jgi:hypothetical protein
MFFVYIDLFSPKVKDLRRYLNMSSYDVLAIIFREGVPQQQECYLKKVKVAFIIGRLFPKNDHKFFVKKIVNILSELSDISLTSFINIFA